MNSKLLTALLLLSFATTVFAMVPTRHFVDGNEVFFGSQIETQNPFEYKLLITNDSQQEKTYIVEERISNQLTLESANYAYSTVALGVYNRYIFNEVTIPANSSVELKMIFKNNTEQIQQSASINTKFRLVGDPPHVTEFELFVFNLRIPAIPEFPIAAAPVAGVLGIAFVMISRGKKQ